jgi:deoxyribose-phosphate aldolase
MSRWCGNRVFENPFVRPPARESFPAKEGGPSPTPVGGEQHKDGARSKPGNIDDAGIAADLRSIGLHQTEANMTRRELAHRIDHTVLKPEATPAAIDQLCDEAREHGFIAVCVNPLYVARCVRRLEGSGVLVASVVGFPLGASRTDIKVDETRRAIADGAVEIDMVIAVGELIAGNTSFIRDDIAALAHEVHGASGRAELKVILETAALTPDQITAGCRCCVDAGADFVKTSTGFHPAGGATVESVRLLKAHSPGLKVKAAGGIRDLATARAMLEAGADRLGCSASVRILGELVK